MTTKINQITVSEINVEVVRKKIKNLHIGVYPPDGRVRVAAPTKMGMEAIRVAVIGKLGWIKKHQLKFANQERQSPREYVTGETHYFQGRRYRLNLQPHDGRPRIMACHGTIELHVPTDSSIEYREALLYAWYRKQLKEQVPELLAKWEQIIGVQAAAWGVKRMKTRWGTCNPTARRVWLNLELIKKPIHCLEYIIVHELVHLLERLHNDRFTTLMDQYMPSWRQYREELNRQPLGHEGWGE
ncbi:MAG: M48 family metallopeptidase [Trichlorobacter sp.]|uniref:M48 family metallopeptidase n=1 Tax=Trichlorobacter sp. TaxID=2911007 RepID=UPI00256E7736|nr:SprT family zinc-dependent metalloprotease [Trichlorobacter sp.]MDK9716557.1 M48 family metallopeptidase [Trichlorobacter sp.]